MRWLLVLAASVTLAFGAAACAADENSLIRSVEVTVGLTVCSSADARTCFVAQLPDILVSIEQSQQRLASKPTDRNGRAIFKVGATGRVTVTAHASLYSQEIIESITLGGPERVVSIDLVDPQPVQIRPLE